MQLVLAARQMFNLDLRLDVTEIRCTGWTPYRDFLEDAVSVGVLCELGYFMFPLKEDNGSTMTDDHRCKLLGCFDCPGQFHHSRIKAK